MKLSFILLLSFASLITQGQITISYVFRDACTDSLYTGPYDLFQFSNSKSYSSNNKVLILDSPGIYLFGTIISRNSEDLLFATKKFYKNGETYIDTIYVPKFLPRQNALDDNSVAFYFCGLKASGIVKDYYPNGVIRMQGDFLNGVPISNIKYFNIKGRLVTKQIYRSGKYIDTKVYRIKDKTEYY